MEERAGTGARGRHGAGRELPPGTTTSTYAPPPSGNARPPERLGWGRGRGAGPFRAPQTLRPRRTAPPPARAALVGRGRVARSCVLVCGWPTCRAPTSHAPRVTPAARRECLMQSRSSPRLTVRLFTRASPTVHLSAYPVDRWRIAREDDAEAVPLAERAVNPPSTSERLRLLSSRAPPQKSAARAPPWPRYSSPHPPPAPRDCPPLPVAQAALVGVDGTRGKAAPRPAAVVPAQSTN